MDFLRQSGLVLCSLASLNTVREELG